MATLSTYITEVRRLLHDANGNFYLPLNSKGKTQSGTKDSMVVVFDGRS